MGTHSLVIFEEVDEKETNINARVHQWWDGSPECVGLILAHFLKKTKCTTQTGFYTDTNMVCNFDCLVAQYIDKEKYCVNGMYVVSKDLDTEWKYYVQYYLSEKKIYIRVENGTDKSDNMSIDEFQEFCYDKVRYPICYSDNDESLNIDELVLKKVYELEKMRMAVLKMNTENYFKQS